MDLLRTSNGHLLITVLGIGMLLCAISLFLTVLLNKILLKFSTNLGVRDQKSVQVRWSTHAKPALGGVAFYLFFLFSFLFYFIFFEIELNQRLEFLSFLIVCSVAFLMGLVDDAYNTKPWLKFSVQLFCAGIFILSGNYIKTFPYEFFNYFITIIWVIGVMNSINMLDNMDGITTSVSWSIVFAIILLILFNPSPSFFYLIISLGVLGSLTGFFYHNWFPSKMFMGDSGSQFLGIFLAWMGVRFFWNGLDFYGEPIQAKQILMVALMFIAPISDTTTVTINRLLRRSSPFKGGRDHTTHALSYNGWAQRHIALLYLFLTLFSGVLVLVAIHINPVWNHVFTAIGALYFLCVFSILFYSTKTKAFKQKQ